MPSWKKLITSGSDAYLNSLNVANSVTASFFTGSFVGYLTGTSSYAITASYVDFDDVAGIHNYTSSVSASITNLSASFLNFSASYNTGSFTGFFSGGFSGSFSGSFAGNGSQLTDVPITQFVTHTASFSNVTSLIVSHTFQSENVVVAVYNDDKVQIIPRTVQVLNPIQVYLEFTQVTSGYVVVIKGGHLLQGDILEVGDFTLHTASFTNVITTSIFHPLRSENITVAVYNTSKSQIIPDRLQVIDSKEFELEFTEPTSGYVVITKGGHIVSGSIPGDQIIGDVFLTGSFTGSFAGDGTQLTGLLQISDFTYRTTITGSTSYNITHSLNEEYVVVQVYDTSIKKQVIPQSIESINQNVVRVTFNTTFNGLAIIKK